MANYTTSTSDKNKNTALLVCLFGGLVGLHYFYVGRISTGLVRLITLNLFGIGWIIDIVTIALGGFRDNVGAPLRA
jgi:restriction system protein